MATGDFGDHFCRRKSRASAEAIALAFYAPNHQQEAHAKVILREL
ncbi:MAG: hypothetical protein V7L05_14530 [Nostoc sp.]